MKSYNILLTASLLSINAVTLINGPAAAQAPVQHRASPTKKLHKSPPVYNMVERSVVGTDNVSDEQVWDVHLATLTPPQANAAPQPPAYHFKSLDAPALLKWVGMLPPKSEIAITIFTGPVVIPLHPEGDLLVKPRSALQLQIDAFGRFCEKHGVSVIEDISGG